MASLTFKEGSKVLMNGIATTTTLGDMQASTDSRPAQLTELTRKRGTPSQKTNEPSCKRRKTQSQHEVDCSPPVTIRTAASPKCPPAAVMGRPMTISPNLKTRQTVASLAPILIYNLALSFHLDALTNDKGECFEKALRAYDMSWRLSSKAQQPSILLPTLHNMSQIYGMECEEGKQLHDGLTKVLRMLCRRNQCYERLFLTMMTGQPNTVAVAA